MIVMFVCMRCLYVCDVGDVCDVCDVCVLQGGGLALFHLSFSPDGHLSLIKVIFAS